MKKFILLPALFTLVLSFTSWALTPLTQESLTELVFEKELFPAIIDYEGEKWNVEYTFDQDLTDFIVSMMKKNKPSFGAAVVVDNESGEILAAVGYEKKGNRLLPYLPFTSSHPAASLAKFVTAAVLVEENDIDIEEKIPYLGRTTTLKPRQIAQADETRKKKRKTRRPHYQNFIEAFASSNNPIFGKAAIENLSGQTLLDMANRLGFNKDLMSDILIERSLFSLAEGNYMVAQYASGYNNQNILSPVHAAFIPSLVMNDGYFYAPHVVRRVYSLDEQTELPLPDVATTQVFNADTVHSLKQMMEATITIGTGRRGFHNLSPELLEKLEIGGKSGTFSGGKPYGKRDWFMAFARPKDQLSSNGISLAVMTINSKRKVRSSKMAKDIIEYYYKDIDHR